MQKGAARWVAQSVHLIKFSKERPGPRQNTPARVCPGQGGRIGRPRPSPSFEARGASFLGFFTPAAHRATHATPTTRTCHSADLPPRCGATTRHLPVRCHERGKERKGETDKPANKQAITL